MNTYYSDNWCGGRKNSDLPTPVRLSHFVGKGISFVSCRGENSPTTAITGSFRKLSLFPMPDCMCVALSDGNGVQLREIQTIRKRVSRPISVLYLNVEVMSIRLLVPKNLGMTVVWKALAKDVSKPRVLIVRAEIKCNDSASSTVVKGEVVAALCSRPTNESSQ